MLSERPPTVYTIAPGTPFVDALAQGLMGRVTREQPDDPLALARATVAGATGYVFWPAVLGIAMASVLTAPLGARLAHALPVARLRSAFAVFLVIVGVKMLLF